MYQARKALGEQGSILYAEGLYAATSVISATQEYVYANPELVKKVV